MGSRIQQRLKAVLPVRISGKNAEGKNFDELTYTLDISRAGARVILRQPVAKGDTVTLAYKQRKATFHVTWVTPQTAGQEALAGLAASDPSVVLWSELRKEEKDNYRDEFTREERERQEAVAQLANRSTATMKAAPKPASAPAAAPAPAAGASPAAPAASAKEERKKPRATVADRVGALIGELLTLDSELQSTNVEPMLLKDLRDALSKVRETAWIAQQRIELRNAGEENALPLISVINNERLSTATRVCSEFMDDFGKADLALDEALVSAFLQVAEQLVFELGLAVS